MFVQCLGFRLQQLLHSKSCWIRWIWLMTSYSFKTICPQFLKLVLLCSNYCRLKYNFKNKPQVFGWTLHSSNTTHEFRSHKSPLVLQNFHHTRIRTRAFKIEYVCVITVPHYCVRSNLNYLFQPVKTSSATIANYLALFFTDTVNLSFLMMYFFWLLAFLGVSRLIPSTCEGNLTSRTV